MERQYCFGVGRPSTLLAPWIQLTRRVQPKEPLYLFYIVKVAHTHKNAAAERDVLSRLQATCKARPAGARSRGGNKGNFTGKASSLGAGVGKTGVSAEVWRRNCL